jgi:transposase
VPGAIRSTALREEKSRPVYNELLSWCRTYKPLEPPKTPLAAACSYLLNHYVVLMRFLDDGSYPTDNGIVERLHRRPAIGRRNFTFVGSHASGERASIAYSILSTCRLIGLNPVAYLADIVPQLARGVRREKLAALMPKPWRLAHAKSSATSARLSAARRGVTSEPRYTSSAPASAYLARAG